MSWEEAATVGEFAVVALAGLAAGWWLRGRRARMRRPESSTGESSLASAAVPPSEAPQALSRASGGGEPNTPTRAPVNATADPPAEVETDGLGLARRVIVHLVSQGRLGAEDVGRDGFTQSGIAGALHVRQGNLSKVLGRLVAAEVLTVDRRHVSGREFRVNVYTLTALGESVARDILHPRDARHRP